MFCVLEFTEDSRRLLAVVPMSWFNGKLVTYKNSPSLAKSGKYPSDTWPKYEAEMRTGTVYSSYDEANAALTRYEEDISSTDSEKDLPKRVAKKRKMDDYQYEDDSDDLEDPGNFFLFLLLQNFYFNPLVKSAIRCVVVDHLKAHSQFHGAFHLHDDIRAEKNVTLSAKEVL